MRNLQSAVELTTFRSEIQRKDLQRVSPCQSVLSLSLVADSACVVVAELATVLQADDPPVCGESVIGVSLTGELLTGASYGGLEGSPGSHS